MKPVALVTGSGRGIGLECAMALARGGFSVALNGLGDDAELASAVERVKGVGADAIAVPFDVTDYGCYASKFELIETRLGPLTTLVNNAGIGVMSRGDILDVTEASYDRCFAVNTKAPFFLTQAFGRHVLVRNEREGHFYSVVNITSSNATAVAEQRGEYCASKAAAAMISKTYAVRFGRENIAVYDVQPGLISTEMTASVIEQYDRRAKGGLTLIPRVGLPEEVGQVVAQLAFGNLKYTTGQVISVDGGMLVSRF